MAERALPVPEGLAGERIDVALARLLGLSRTKAAALVDDGLVSIDGVVPHKSDVVSAGAWLEVSLPDPRPAATVAAEPVPGPRPPSHTVLPVISSKQTGNPELCPLPM